MLFASMELLWPKRIPKATAPTAISRGLQSAFGVELPRAPHLTSPPAAHVAIESRRGPGPRSGSDGTHAAGGVRHRADHGLRRPLRAGSGRPKSESLRDCRS